MGIRIFFDGFNKNLFENTPPYMNIRPSLKGGLYMSVKWLPFTRP